MERSNGACWFFLLVSFCLVGLLFPVSTLFVEGGNSENEAPEMVQAIPDLVVDEDSIKTFSFDIRDHFTDDITNSTDLDYGIELRGRNLTEICVIFTGYWITIDATLIPNFNTFQYNSDIEGRVLVTDTGDLNRSDPKTNYSNWFSIDVNPVNDLPIWTGSSLYDLWVWEGSSMNVTNLDDHDLFNDVEGDSLNYFAVANLSFEGYDESAEFRIGWLRPTNQIAVLQNDNTNFTGEVPVRLFCHDRPSVNFNTDPFIDIKVEVKNINDPPVCVKYHSYCLTLDEGTAYALFNMSSKIFFEDGDGDHLRYRPVVDLSFPGYDECVEFNVIWKSSVNQLEIQINESSDWNGRIPLRLFCTDQDEFDLKTDPFVDLPVVINNVNDPPRWKDISEVSLVEDLPISCFLDLAQYIIDVDSSPIYLDYRIDSYSNSSHMKIFQENDNPYFLSFEPITENWYGSSIVNISVDDQGSIVHTSFELFIDPVNDLPVIDIRSPREDERIEEGYFSVYGDAFDAEEIDRIEIFYEDRWVEALGTEQWGVTIRSPYVEGITNNVPIMVRVFDIDGQMNYDYVNVTIIPVPYKPLDWDRDGVPDDEDDFMYDKSASIDSDSDGYPDQWNFGMGPGDSNSFLELDEFPSDPKEWEDSDGDGYGDNGDDFPNNDEEWSDQDGDGVGDNADEFPRDTAETSDIDKDGVGDNRDAFPMDPSASVDEDRDGYPDRWNPGMSEKDSNTDLKLDHHPDDSMKWEKEGLFDRTPIPLLLLIFLLPPLLIGALIGIYLYFFKGPKDGETVPIMGNEKHGNEE